MADSQISGAVQILQACRSSLQQLQALLGGPAKVCTCVHARDKLGLSRMKGTLSQMALKDVTLWHELLKCALGQAAGTLWAHPGVTGELGPEKWQHMTS